MRNMQKILAMLMLAAMAAGLLAGCDKAQPAGDRDEIGQDGQESPPSGFVDNEIDPGDYTEAEIYFTDPDRNAIIGVNDGNVFYENAGFSARFAVNMITSASGDAVPGLPVSAIADKVDYVRFGDKTYRLEDLVRPRGEGFTVLQMLASDFGVDRYAEDESGTMVLAECMGTEVSGDALREAYSERADFEDYTVCVYYLHARMSGMAPAEYEKCRKALQDAHGIDHSSLLDGTLAVMLYYDTDGYDLFYAVAAAAPGYWTNYEDFLANPDNQSRHDITNCMMMMDGVKPVGFVNQVFIRCDQDTSGLETDAADDVPDGGNQAASGGDVQDRPSDDPEGGGE